MGLQSTTGLVVQWIWGPLGLRIALSSLVLHHGHVGSSSSWPEAALGLLVMSQGLLQAAAACSPVVLTSSEVLLVVAVAVPVSELGPELLHTHVFLCFQVTNYDSVTGLPLIQLWNLMGDEVGIDVYVENSLIINFLLLIRNLQNPCLLLWLVHLSTLFWVFSPSL